MAARNLVLAVIFVASSGAARARVAEPEPEVPVRLIGADRIGGPALHVAKAVATRLLASASVGLRWSEGAASKAKTGAIEIQFRDFAPTCHPAGTLAEARPYASGGVRIVVFLDRVEGFSEHQPLFVPRILGHVLAHEIGHVLLGTDGHSWTGVMKAHWDDADYRAMRTRGLQFAPENIAAIHLRLMR